MRHITPLAAATLVLASPLSAHHSDAALEMDSVATFEGVVTEYSLRNPHSYFTVETTNARGESVEWEVQMGSAISLSRRGWTRDTFSVGDRVAVSVRPARDGRPYGLLTSVEKAGAPVSYARLPATVGATTTTLEGKWILDPSSLAADLPRGSRPAHRLTVEFMLEDPEYIVGSMTHARDLIYSPQIEMTPFNCDLEATRRFLPQ